MGAEPTSMKPVSPEQVLFAEALQCDNGANDCMECFHGLFTYPQAVEGHSP